jgi:hypothetical protein
MVELADISGIVGLFGVVENATLDMYTILSNLEIALWPIFYLTLAVSSS